MSVGIRRVVAPWIRREARNATLNEAFLVEVEIKFIGRQFLANKLDINFMIFEPAFVGET